MSVVQFPISQAREAIHAQPPVASDVTGANVVTLRGICPWSDDLSDYDQRNINLYARLLYDESEGASEDDLAWAMGLDPYRHRSRTLRILRSHLKRAHWVADQLLLTYC